MEGKSQELAAAFEAGPDRVLVVTGAGISHASGIPTFRGRDAGAIWRLSDVEMATHAFFQEDPVEQWRWYLERFERLDGAQPNPAHRALAALERWQEARGGGFELVTQNIDTLHEAGGSRRLIKVHGSADRVRCSRDGCAHGAPAGSLPRSAADLDAFRKAPGRDRLPRCPDCGSPLRAHVLFFDEYYQAHEDYRFDDAVAAAASADLVLFAGTSFSVGITEIVLREGQRQGTPMFSIDPDSVSLPARFHLGLVPEPAERVLPWLCERLGAPIETSAEENAEETAGRPSGAAAAGRAEGADG